MIIRLHTHEFVAELSDNITLGLMAAGTVLRDECRETVSIPVVKEGKRVVERSKPGEAPRLETGFGQRNVIWWMSEQANQKAVRVGIRDNAMYMAFHELGLRPWLVVTFERVKDKLAKAFMIGARGKA